MGIQKKLQFSRTYDDKKSDLGGFPNGHGCVQVNQPEDFNYSPAVKRGWKIHYKWKFSREIYPLVNVYITMENHHLVREFSHEKL